MPLELRNGKPMKVFDGLFGLIDIEFYFCIDNV